MQKTPLVYLIDHLFFLTTSLRSLFFLLGANKVNSAMLRHRVEIIKGVNLDSCFTLKANDMSTLHEMSQV